MHELSLAGGIVRLVEEAAARESFVRVRRIVIEAGALSGVEVPALRFALDAVMPGTCLAGAEVEIAEPPARARCAGCGETVEIRSRLDDCPRCGAASPWPLDGTALRVRELIVQDV